MQKLFRGYISRKKSAEEQINNARRIVLLQSLFRKRLALRVLRTKMSIRDFCLDILSECIDLAVPEHGETEENNAGNGFQLFITGTIQHTEAEGVVLLARTIRSRSMRPPSFNPHFPQKYP